MKLGQIVKNILDQLNKQVWVKKSINGSDRYCLEMNIDPQYADSVSSLIYGGLAELNTNFGVKTSENNFSLRIISPYEKKPENSSTTDFIKKLAVGIDAHVKKITNGWRESAESEDNLHISGGYFFKGSEQVILEHDYIFLSPGFYSTPGIYLDPSNLLWEASRMFLKSNSILGEKQGRIILTIPFVPKNYNPAAEHEHIYKTFIAGDKDVVFKFVESLKTDLSPLTCDRLVEAKESEQQKSLTQGLKQYSIFNLDSVDSMKHEPIRPGFVVR